MKIFISKSGERSRTVAEALRNWLPHVIQGLQPWISSEDIDKGARWAREIASQLEQCRVGIICLTPENIEAPWILFEAGALSKTVDQTFVCPYLTDLEPTDIKGPLDQFQAAKSNKEDTRKLIQTINRAQGEAALPENRIDAAFEKWWPDLEQQVRNLPPPQKTEGSAALLAAVKFFLDGKEISGDGIRWHYHRLVSSTRRGFATSVISLLKSASFNDFLRRAGVSVEVMSFEESKARQRLGPHTGQVLAASNGPILGNGSDDNLHYVLFPDLQLWIDDRVFQELEKVHFDFKRTYTEVVRDAVGMLRPEA